MPWLLRESLERPADNGRMRAVRFTACDCAAGIMTRLFPLGDLPLGKAVKTKLVKFKTMLGGERVETVEQATDLAVEGVVTELDDDTPADMQSVENIHDTLSRLDALSKAGKIGKIS